MKAVSTAVASGIAALLGGALTVVGQWISDRGSQREVAVRESAQRGRLRADEERRNLYEIQDQMVELSDSVVAMRHGDSAARLDASASFSHMSHRLRALLERIPNAAIRDLLARYVEAKQQEAAQPGSTPPSAFSSGTYADAQVLIGSAIRALDERR
ncbi:hypothetical protein AB0J83_03655 [Actinoplanes sp. NPDC049596]|uniref:hypothetical protein n=1 Tax=unclassified Actinoplanes TaxID=2626549 RepID=UPI00344AA43B